MANTAEETHLGAEYRMAARMMNMCLMAGIYATNSLWH